MVASWIAIFIVVLALLLTAEFVVSYQIKSQGAWRRSTGGQAIMLLMAALTLILLAAALGLYETSILDRPRTPVTAWLRLIGFAAVPVAVFRLRLLLRRTLPGTPPE